MFKLIALSSLPISAALFWSSFTQASVVVMFIGAIAAFPMVYSKRTLVRVRK